MREEVCLGACSGEWSVTCSLFFRTIVPFVVRDESRGVEVVV